MFAKRTDWELTPNRLTGLADSLKGSRTPVIDLTVSNPSRCGLDLPRDKMLSALVNQGNADYEPDPQGLLSARQALCEFYSAQGNALKPEQIFLTASTSEAYSFLFRLLADPQDVILFPSPSYPLFDFLVGLNDLRMDYYRLCYDQGWHIALDDMEKRVNKDVRAMVFVNPNNPTGSFLRAEEIKMANTLGRRFGIPIVSDEVFASYAFDGQERRSSFLNNQETLTFVLGGLSKTCVLPQMKLSWIIISGPDELVREARVRLEVIADTYLSVNTPAQHALKDWLAIQPQIHKVVMERLRANYRAIEKFCEEFLPCQCLRADGGWYVMVRIPEHLSEEECVVKILEKHHVLVHPGYFFDCEEGPCLVLSLLVPQSSFEEGCRRIAVYLNKQ